MKEKDKFMYLYTVQKKEVAELLINGTYVPDLRKGFSSEHSYFMVAYTRLKALYGGLTGIPMSQYETGIWAYPKLEYIDRSALGEDEVVLKVTVLKSNVLLSNYSTWEGILDGDIPFDKGLPDLVTKVDVEEGYLVQGYFSVSAIEGIEILK